MYGLFTNRRGQIGTYLQDAKKVGFHLNMNENNQFNRLLSEVKRRDVYQRAKLISAFQSGA